MFDAPAQAASFAELNLPAPLLAALEEVGYESPSPIQAQAIPHLLQGLDILGHAPTGTGKTAAFALPLLARIDLEHTQVQVMVLTPTRELAIQVAEAFQRYASKLKGFHVLPIYGGQDYSGQLRMLKRGVHLVVGTPGRVMDHMRKGKLSLEHLQALVLDEADEMLRMGFIDDVEWILEQSPPDRQIALFSATMPKEIQAIARQHLHEPKEIAIKAKTATAETIRQRYWLVSGLHKLDALTRILEVEDFDGIIIFVRTKVATQELAERLEARGYGAAALNGDMAQKLREQIVERFRQGGLDILVATDVAARGLDVERVSLVINYDIPHDAESYIHRIGRTGRAGRQGDAILFVAPRERRMLAVIERATRSRIDPLQLPSSEMVNNQRIAKFKQSISDTLAAGEIGFMQGLLEQYQQEQDVTPLEIAAALAKLYLGDQPLLMEPDKKSFEVMPDRKGREGRAPEQLETRTKRPRRDPFADDPPPRAKARKGAPPPEGMERFRIEVGRQHGVKPGNIVGAIANEAGLDSQYIGYIEILDDHSLIDLPLGMPKDIFQELKKVWVCNQQLRMSRVTAAASGSTPAGAGPDRSNKLPESETQARPQSKPKPKKPKTKKDAG
jgi:ATP-dependent RNA helicase DeaD